MASSLVAVAYGDTALAIAGFAGTSVAHGVMAPNVFATGQTLDRHRRAHRHGIPRRPHGLVRVGLIVASSIASIGIIGWSVMVRRIAPLDWSRGV